MDRCRIVQVLVARRRAHEAAAVHQVVILRAGERERLAGPLDLHARAERQRVGRADRVRVEAGAGGEAAAARPAVAEVHRHAVVRVADDGEKCALDRTAAERQLDQFGDDLAVLAARERRRLGRPQLRGGFQQRLRHDAR